MSTKAQLEHKLHLTECALADAKRNSITGADLGDISSALLERLEVLKDDKQRELDAAENAFDAADTADDYIQELG